MIPSFKNMKIDNIVIFCVLLIVVAAGYQYKNIQRIKENLAHVEGFQNTTTTSSITAINNQIKAKEDENADITRIIIFVTGIQSVLEDIDEEDEIAKDATEYTRASNLKEIVIKLRTVQGHYASLQNLDVTTTTAAATTAIATATTTGTRLWFWVIGMTIDFGTIAIAIISSNRRRLGLLT